MYILFDWPDDPVHAGGWDMESPGIGNHDDYWREHFNTNHGGFFQQRTLTMDPQRFFWDHLVMIKSDVHDDGSDDLRLTYWTTTMIPPLRGPLDFWNNGIGPEPAWMTPFSGTAPMVVQDYWAWGYSGAQTLTLVVTDDDGGSAMKALTIV